MFTLHHGDSREVLRSIPDASIDSCVTDPPYALVSIGKRFGADGAAPAQSKQSGVYARASAGFMGQKWDTGEVAFDPDFWREVWRVLKPGAHVVAFGGTRTYHRLACAIEDAGFEIRDMVSWLYGSGFPKSHDVSKGIDKAAGAVREVVATGDPVKRMIPGADQARDGWEKTNGREYVPTETAPATPDAERWEGWGTALKPACEPCVLARKPLTGTVVANVLRHGTGALNIDGCRVGDGDDKGVWPETARTSERRSMAGAMGHADTDLTAGRWPANVVHDGAAEVVAAFPNTAGGGRIATRLSPKLAGAKGDFAGNGASWEPYDDDGSAARFFYSAKADKADRAGSAHPTVKPVDLMAWLVRLVTPPGGVVLDPFAGSGSTGAAAYREGFHPILIEREAAFFADIERRMAAEVAERERVARHIRGDDLPLFA